MLASHALLFINKDMSAETEFTVPAAPMAKLLSVILIIGQWILAIGFVCLILMAALMLIPGDFRDGLIADLPSNLPASTLAGRCLASAVVAVGWFFVLRWLRRVVRAVIHGDPFLPENVSHLRRIWITIAATEIFRMIAMFIIGGAAGPEDVDVTRLDIRLGTWFLIFIIAAISEAFRHGAALRAEQELTI
jgi:hypothetical protein